MLQLETNPFETDKVALGAFHIGLMLAKGEKEAARMADDLGNF